MDQQAAELDGARVAVVTVSRVELPRELKMTKVFSDRRLLLKCEGNSYKLLSFSQKNDGSIYIAFPDFRNIKWMGVYLDPQVPRLEIVDSTNDEGKLSFHASGMVGFRSHNTPGDHKLLIRGNYLYNRHNATAGIRHLASIFMEEPGELPEEFPQRQGDFWIQNSSALKPFVLLLFAVPLVSNLKKVGISLSFHMDDLETTPPEGGGGVLELKYHGIFWYIYRTKFMDRWPKQSYVCYHDGFVVPMYRGRHRDEVSGELRFEVHTPEYEIQGEELKIILEDPLSQD